MEKFLITLAYKHVAMAVMLALANDFTKKAEIPITRPLTLADVQQGSHFSPPRLNGFGGSVVTSNHFFGFSRGYLANFKKLEPSINSDAAQQARNEELAKSPNSLDSSGAYDFAVACLSRIGVAPVALKSNYTHKVTQRSFFPRAKGFVAAQGTGPRGSTLLPVFDIEWAFKGASAQAGPYPVPAIALTIFGPTKELVELHITDDHLVPGKTQPVKDVEKLLAIKDADFTAYTEQQKSDLLSRFSAIPLLPIEDQAGQPK